MELTPEDIITVVLAGQRGSMLEHYAEKMATELYHARHNVEELTLALEHSNAQEPGSPAYEEANQNVAAQARLSLEAEASFLAAILEYVEAQHSGPQPAEQSPVNGLFPW